MGFSAQTAALLRLARLAHLGTRELVAMYARGDLEARHVWTAIRGAEKYRAAIAAGDVASEAVQTARVEACTRCLSRTTRDVDGRTAAHYCGPAFEDNTGGVIPTCGCLTSVTVDGQILPGGKAAVGSAKCDQGRW